MAANRDRVVAALESNAAGLCDDCLADAIGMKGIGARQSVNQICRGLQKQGVVARTKQKCPGRCRDQDKYVNCLQSSESPRKPVEPPERQDAVLNQYWRQMDKMLRLIDNRRSPSVPEGFVDTVRRLRTAQPRVDDIAESMLTVNGLRVRGVKKGSILRTRQWNILELAWDEIQDWWHKQPESKRE